VIGSDGVETGDGFLEVASRAGCGQVLSEDLNAGQVIRGVRIENPFAV
jgi:predicted nucleic acid-binding protein